jgi:mannose-6-phosphate isomerase-like protein (cupin superfamily)
VTTSTTSIASPHTAAPPGAPDLRGTPATAHPLVRAPGSPGAVRHLGVTVNTLVRASDTAGAWCLLDYTMPPGYAGPPPHRHARTTETFYCVSGTLTLRLDGCTVDLRPGEAAVVPPGVAHAFGNRGESPATMLVYMTPGGFEAYFDEVAALAAASPVWPPADPGVIPAILTRYDYEG